MVKKFSIGFNEVTTPITESVTKFGGQPTWQTEPTWPLSRATGKPMQFICQIKLEPEIFGETLGKMAYLFMTDADEEIYDTWQADSGENAVIIQPAASPLTLPIENSATGPYLYKMVKDSSGKFLVPQACEYSVNLQLGKDPDVFDIEKRRASDPENDAWWKALAENKIGGTPVFLQDQENSDWRLLLQLDSSMVPFYLNFGNAGVGYAFLSDDGKIGRFLWQGC